MMIINLAIEMRATVLGWDESETDYKPRGNDSDNRFNWANHLPVQLIEQELNDEDMT